MAQQNQVTFKAYKDSQITTNGVGSVTAIKHRSVLENISDSVPFILDNNGTYTPTLTEDANIDSSQNYVCQWMRMGSVVTVSGSVDVDPTSSSTLTTLGISLPVASDFADENQLGGTAFDSSINQGAVIYADVTNNRASLEFTSLGTGSIQLWFTFTYLIV